MYDFCYLLLKFLCTLKYLTHMLFLFSSHTGYSKFIASDRQGPYIPVPSAKKHKKYATADI